MMTCRELVEFLMDYVSGDLPPDQHQGFETHLALCPPCVEFMRTYEETIRMGKCACTDPDGPIPDAVPRRLVEAILAARKGEGSDA